MQKNGTLCLSDCANWTNIGVSDNKLGRAVLVTPPALATQPKELSRTATVPTPRPRVKPTRTVQLVSRPDPVGLLAITVGKERTAYLLERIPADFGAAFSLTKLELVEAEPGVHELRRADPYHVHFDRTLGDSCDCKGFVAHRHCKHRDALAELIGQGLL